jgi:hypothetical protein
LLWEAAKLVLAVLGKRVAGRSAAQSFAAQVVAGGLAALVQWPAELALKCLAPDFVRQAAQNWLLEPQEYGLPEQPRELKLEER